MSEMELNQMLEYGQQLLTVLSGDETEVITMQNILEISRQVKALRQKQQEQLKQDIQYLTKEMTAIDTDRGDISTASDDLTNLEASMQSRVEASSSQSATVVKECQQLKEELTKVQKEQQSLKEKHQLQKDSKTTALPKARCDANLYSNITNLRWQFNAEPHEVKGYICNNNDVKTFNLNSQEVSRFFITNYLWDMIEEDW